ncbi:MAG: hypothetical protein JO040_03265 [Gemmatimonadetes bacterium]|nr:hypothetical protein [Gemmatimonadota bacterium]
MKTFTIERSQSGRGLAPRLAVGLLAVALAGCNTDSLVQLDDPDLITGAVARDTANIASLRNGVIYEFSRAVGGTAANNETPGLVGVTGLFADELWYASTFNSMQDIDRRSIVDLTNSDLTRVFQRIQRARNISEQALGQYAAAGKTNSVDAAMLTNFAGYSYIFLAENFCNGVPISTTTLTGDLTYGAPQSTQALLDSATNRFNSALALANAVGSTAATQQYAARVGIGRALLDAGRFTEAAAAVASVPTSFVFNAPYSENSTGQNNGVWYNINSEKRTSAASGEGVNGLVFFRRAARPTGSPANFNSTDPRVLVDSVGRGLSTTVPLYAQNKYPTRGTVIPVASGVEARLIEAEAALNKGTSAAYIPLLNTLRQSVGITTPLTDPGAGNPRVRQFFQERAFFLWLTAHRLSDLRRMIRQYGFTQDQVFPTGQTIFGSPYGSDVNLPIPFQERNNPEFTSGQCTDRNA